MYIFKYVKYEQNKYDLSDVTFEVINDVTVHELMGEFKKFLLAVGFQPGSIDEYIQKE